MTELRLPANFVMESIGPFTHVLLILVVILFFNLIIFVHELGHFWAAKWRGLRIDRFQIWFGKPIWKKEVNGVQYGLGWIPAGGFVALPQMAPMEAIEGDHRKDKEALPPISPLDKIIVAFAGPLFSFLLAFTAAVLIWVVGKPEDSIPTRQVGWVQKDSPAERAGFQRGDEIIAVNGNPVDMWVGTLDSVLMQVVTSKGQEISFTVNRPGVGEMTLVSEFEIPETEWWQRRAVRQVGISPMEGPVAIIPLSDSENAPAVLAGLEAGDLLLAFNDTPIVDSQQAFDFLQANGAEPVEVTVQRDGEEKVMTVTPVKPTSPVFDPPRYMIGATFVNEPGEDGGARQIWVRPSPVSQVVNVLRQMWVTVSSVASADSSLGIQHLSGPVGIGKIQFYSLLMDHPMNRLLEFMVLININLALLNLLPLPVLDGGHITIAVMESIARRPVNVKFLEVLQLGFVFLLFSVMIYVTSKDVADDFGMGSGPKREKLVFPAPAES
ncbi:regulator of sigma E protease [Haloferula luteola]|uniref:Zinc metalloprotease n=1 Tax=Haloferula luteola TaxID=595692 RepID=A0A840VFD9_9BACT|nr:RIP metalloprotease RseP [Haloferula luteola]MBB5352530.1 regulator of sigma E protease [Haloferula luteola]